MKKEVRASHATSSRGGFDIASLVIGIVALILVFLPWGPALSFVLGIVGLVCGYIQRKQGQTRIGRAGMILNILAIALAVIVVVIAFVYLRNHPELLAQLQGLAATP